MMRDIEAGTGRSRAALTALCIGALLLLMGCMSAVPPARTLPGHIKRVYVKEFKNNSRMFGAQADLTLHVQDELLEDGRLDVVQNERADVRLEGRIKETRETTGGTSDDRFPLYNVMQMECVVDLWDPYDCDAVAPQARYRATAAITYVPDQRRSIDEAEVDARDRLLRQMAKNIVQTILTGTPEQLKPEEKKKIERYQERNSVQKYEPMINQPRFPKPDSPGK